MLIFLSPAKSLDYKTPPQVTTHTQPAFLAQSKTLISQLRKLSPADIANLMDLSDPLALLIGQVVDQHGQHSQAKDRSRERSPQMMRMMYQI